VADPGPVDLSTEPQPIQETGNGTAYEWFESYPFDLAGTTLEYDSVTFDTPEPPPVYNGVWAFSTMARETGGMFMFIPEVNYGTPSDIERYEHSIFNIVQGGIAQSISLIQPPFGPVGSSMVTCLTGSHTNFQPGTMLTFEGGGITVSDMDVVSSVEIEAVIDISPGAAPSFRDVTAITDLGGGVIDTAIGTGAFEVIEMPSGPSITSIAPMSAPAGHSLTVTVYGANTHFSESSALFMGNGIVASDVVALSEHVLQASIDISHSAEVGFRNVSVQTDGEVAAESMTGPFFVSAPSPEEPELVSIDPSESPPGSVLSVTVTGLNTSFVDGVSVLSFSGSGITALSCNVTSLTTLEATVQIDGNTEPGYRDVRVTTGSEIAVLLDGFLVNVPEEPPEIECPESPIDTFACGLGELCIPLEISHAAIVNAGTADWEEGKLCFQVDSAGSYGITVIAHNDYGEDTCDLIVNVEFIDPVTIECPDEPIDVVIEGSGEVCVDLPIYNHINVDAGGASWSDNMLCFDVDTTGSYQLTIVADNQCGTDSCSFLVIVQDYICGDADYDGATNIVDVVYTINYIFIGGSEPYPYFSGDVNCDGKVNLTDVVYLINYLLRGGNEPCDTNGDGVPDC
jgi:hypothetical protein